MVALVACLAGCSESKGPRTESFTSTASTASSNEPSPELPPISVEPLPNWVARDVPVPYSPQDGGSILADAESDAAPDAGAVGFDAASDATTDVTVHDGGTQNASSDADAG